MAKISLNKLNLNKNTEVKVITINEQEVEVISYLPLKEKMDLIEIVINESSQGRVCNPVLLDSLFHAYLVLSYTNITFSPTQHEKILETYDLLEKNGVIAEIIAAIPQAEYTDLVEGLYSCVEVAEREAGSVISLVEGAISRITSTLEETKDKLGELNLDGTTIKNVLAIAKDNGAI